MNYTTGYFINKFEAIPEDRFTTHEFKLDDKRCFMGHCLSDEVIHKLLAYGSDETNYSNYKITEEEMQTSFKEAYELAKLFNPISPRKGTRICYDINNGCDIRYQQLTPKQRILTALYDIKAMKAVKQAEQIINEPDYSLKT